MSVCEFREVIVPATRAFKPCTVFRRIRERVSALVKAGFSANLATEYLFELCVMLVFEMASALFLHVRKARALNRRIAEIAGVNVG